ncbi:MAG: MBL fold metallo-hydrolase, partial [Clostridia bacterium]
MSKKKTANKNQFGQIKYFAIVLAMLLIGYGIWYFVSKGISLDGTSIMSTDDSNVSGSSSAIGETVVRVLDIGQGDCILITTPGEKHVLIDAGDIKNKGAVTSKLKKFGVNKIEYALFTHPHSDH